MEQLRARIYGCALREGHGIFNDSCLIPPAALKNIKVRTAAAPVLLALKHSRSSIDLL